MRSRDGIDQSGKFEISAHGRAAARGSDDWLRAAIVFLLGIYVGKGIVEQRMAQESRVVRLPVPTPGAGGQEATRSTSRSGTSSPRARRRRRRRPRRAATAVETPRACRRRVGATPPPPPPDREAKSRPRRRPRRRGRRRLPSPEGGRFQIQVNAMADHKRVRRAGPRPQGSRLRCLHLVGARRRQDAVPRASRWISPRRKRRSKRSRDLREQGYPNAFLGRRGQRAVSA